ncbi:MAG: hypothetical protein Q7R54_01680 [bacterium]|nr:hypothetical protein [bacterium]
MNQSIKRFVAWWNFPRAAFLVFCLILSYYPLMLMGEMMQRNARLNTLEKLIEQLHTGDEFVSGFDTLNDTKYCKVFVSYNRDSWIRLALISQYSQNMPDIKSRHVLTGDQEDYFELGCPEDGIRL